MCWRLVQGSGPGAGDFDSQCYSLCALFSRPVSAKTVVVSWFGWLSPNQTPTAAPTVVARLRLGGDLLILNRCPEHHLCAWLGTGQTALGTQQSLRPPRALSSGGSHSHVGDSAQTAIE